jgi:hypothetical protein
MVAFRTTAGHRIDFITINDPTAPTDTPEEFIALLKATADAAGTEGVFAAQARLLLSLTWHAGFKAPAIGLHVARQTARTTQSSSAFQQYWTGVVRARAVLRRFTFIPLARASDIVLPMAAGPELSVAATKTFVTSLSAWLHLVAGWAELDALQGAIERLPDRLAAAMRLDWSPALQALSAATSLVSLGRGPTLAIAREAALKLKETSNFHAEAFSGAEFVHGPIALIEASYPVLLFMPTDQAADGLRVLAADLRRKNANVFMTDNQDLPALAPDHPDTDAVCLIQSFYPLALRVAQRRGTDVDLPRHLQKVTLTR